MHGRHWKASGNLQENELVAGTFEDPYPTQVETINPTPIICWAMPTMRPFQRLASSGIFSTMLDYLLFSGERTPIDRWVPTLRAHLRPTLQICARPEPLQDSEQNIAELHQQD
jgi:hypothetical protein